jgi:hypothetical protein
LTYSRHDLVEKWPTWRLTRITHSLIHQKWTIRALTQPLNVLTICKSKFVLNNDVIPMMSREKENAPPPYLKIKGTC